MPLQRHPSLLFPVRSKGLGINNPGFPFLPADPDKSSTSVYPSKNGGLMKTRKTSILMVISIIALVLQVVVISTILGFVTNSRKQKILEEFAPPEVILTSPAAGSMHPAGLMIEVSGSALGYQPISLVELWLDGALIETRISEQLTGITPFSVNFGLLIPEGVHNIVIRAVNSKGVVGQSIPLNIYGIPADNNATPSYVFTADEGETLEELGVKTGLNPNDILAANPALANGVPAGGMNVLVPIDEEKSKEEVKPAAPPQNQPGPNPVPGGGSELDIKLIPALGFILAPPPAAPTNLTIETDVCWIKLQWKDNAVNETGYRVWRSSPGKLPNKMVELKSSPGTGMVKYQFAVPFGGVFNIWVEAVNMGGGQPSNILTIDTMACVAKDYDKPQDGYELEITGMRSSLTPEKSYCYVSLDHQPDIRIPKDENSFIEVQAGVFNISAWATGSNKYILSKANTLIFVEMECWGWQGGSLINLGNIEATEITQDKWNGNQITLVNKQGNPTLWIELNIKRSEADWNTVSSNSSQLNSMASSMKTAAFNEDPSILVPGNVRLERYGSADGNASDIAQYEYFWERTLKWDMNGDKSKVTGYGIYLNGNPYKIVEGSSAGETQVKLPATCGKTLRWQVAALSNQAQSALSTSVDELLPPCYTYISVTYYSLVVECMSDGWGVCGNIAGQTLRHSAEAYYYLSVGKLNSGKVTQYFYWGDSNFHPALSVGYYQFKDLGEIYVKGGKYPSADTLVIPVYTDDISFDVEVEIWDHDSDSDHDLLFHHKQGYDWNRERIEQIRDNCKIGQSVDKKNDSAEIRMFYEIEVLPNPCTNAP